MHVSDPILRALLAHAEIDRLLGALRAHDEATFEHSLRVADLVLAMGRGEGLEIPALENLAVSALFHDLGKTGLEGDLLGKTGPLGAGERRRLRRHASLSVPEIRKLTDFPDAHRIAPLHHETGGEEDYPRSGSVRRGRGRRKTPGRRAPLSPELTRAGRILALADRFDALVSARPYKEALPEKEVRDRLAVEMPDVAHLLRHVAQPEG